MSTDKAINYIEGTAIMVNTAIGGGISLIATPAGLRHLGIFWFIITEIICAVFTFISLYVLVYVADQLKKPRSELQKNQTNTNKIPQFQELMIFASFPLLSKQMVNITVMINCFGVGITFLSVIHDILNDITDNKILITILLIFSYLFFVIFAIAVNNPKKMSYVSKVASTLWITFMILLGYNSIYSQFIHSHNKPNSNNGDSSFSFGIGISAVMLSWISQFQILTVHNSIKDGQQNVNTMTYKVILPMVLILFSIYVIDGIFCFWSFGDNIADDITKNIYVIHHKTNTFEIDSKFAITAAICLGIAQLISAPLFFIHFKKEMLSFLDTLGFEVYILFNDKNEKLINETENVHENVSKTKWKYGIISIGCLVTIIAAYTVKDVEIIIGYIGTLTCAIAWFMPPCVFFIHRSNVVYKPSQRICLYVYSILSILCWMVLLPIGFIADSM